MKNNQKNAFSWGNYDYSNLSSDIAKKIPTSNAQSTSNIYKKINFQYNLIIYYK